MDFETYERLKRTDYIALAETVASILTAAIRAEPNLRIQQVQHRGKDSASLKEKLRDRGHLTTTTLEADIKDLAGCRLVFYTNSDVSRFLNSGIVRDNFDIDWDRTKIHHPRPESDDANTLFISNNYVLRLKEDRTALPEYARFGDMWCEVQVQTTLNHAWSEMAHDTIYKRPAIEGFGGKLFEGIEKRMQTIMRKYLLPAGYEFQKVVGDFERLSSGKELFDQGALEALAGCDDNNARHDLLERFAEYVLPYYDDVQSVYPDIRVQVVATVKEARKTPTQAVETPFGDLPGHTVEEIVDVAAGILEHLRYVNIEATFDAICELFPGAATDEERNRLLPLAERLSKHELNVWKEAGPLVQSILVERIRSLDDELLAPLSPVLLRVLDEVLKSEVTGTSSTYESVTFHTGAVHPSEMLTSMRSEAIGVLKTLYRKARTDTDRRAVMGALFAATEAPHRGNYSDALFKIILDNTRTIVEFYTEIAEGQSYEILQTLEYKMLWLYRRNQDMPAETAVNPEIAEARDRLTERLLAFRDRINTDHSFVVYKILVGFESVFPPAWKTENFDFGQEKEYREQRIRELIEEVTEESADDWLAILTRCAQTESNDGATFLSFGHFLEELGEAKPQIILQYLDRLDESLSPDFPDGLPI